MSKPPISAKRVVVTSFIVDIGDVALNVTAAILSGSVVVLTEALQGAADLLTSGLLWFGLSRSRRRASPKHRFGYGKEQFFWILMAGVSMFILTAGFSFYFGFSRFLHPQPVHNIGFAYASLVIGLITNTYALSLSLRRLRVRRWDNIFTIWSKIKGSAFIEAKATAILDSMGATAAALGLLSLLIYAFTGDVRFDGIGAMVVGAVCSVFALMLIYEVKDFIIGRSAPTEVEDKIRAVAQSHNDVLQVLDLRTMQMGSERVLVNLEVHLSQSLTTHDIELSIDAIKRHIKKQVPSVQHIQVELETPSSSKS